ncbi:MAG: FAD-binding oxidoreductase [Microthrixaceae bacterium]
MQQGSRDSFSQELISALGPDGVLTEPASLYPYRHDASLMDGEAPMVACLPRDTAEVVLCVRIAARHGKPFVARGAGTGLAGGAVPLGDALLISTMRMDRLLSLDATSRRARVQPGVLNLDLDRAARAHGLRFAPDPSSQQACTIGGNIANNSGGPHCLALGVTSAHVESIEVVLADAEVVELGGADPDPAGYDLRGAFIGSEGTLGIATEATLRLLPRPSSVATLLCTFDDIDAAAACVSDVISAGIVPAALEMMDGPLASAVEDFCGAGYPRDAAAVLLVELEGEPAGVAAETSEVSAMAAARGAREVREADNETEREALWRGRKNAFGAVARIAPDYYLHDTVVPRTMLVDVLRQIRLIAADEQLAVVNVFHAGDGNLHPLLLFDRSEPGVLERVHRAGDRIVGASLAAGGVLSGEHGIGIEKRQHMESMFTDVDLEAQRMLRCAFDPLVMANPQKVLPGGSGCGDPLGAGRSRGSEATGANSGSAEDAAGSGLWI